MRREFRFWRTTLLLTALLAATFSALVVCENHVQAVTSAQATNALRAANKSKHVLIISIDGFHQNDLADPALTADMPNIIALANAGVSFSNAYTPTPSDSFPGIIGIMTGASPKTTGIYYDVSYSRSLYAPGTTVISPGVYSNPPGTQINWDETLDKDNTKLNAVDGGAVSATTANASAINVANLPLISTNGNLVAFYPHSYPMVNNIFEVAHAAGFRTAWSDKHPAYEILNGPSGTGLDDLFTPEIESTVSVVNGVLVSDPNGKSPKKDITTALAYDDLKVQAVLNQIQGKTSIGGTVTNNVVPGIFGMNFLAVSSFEKLLGTNGGIDIVNGAEVPSANLHAALQHTDQSIGKIVAALKAANLYNNTLIVLTAKHGQGPRTGVATTVNDPSTTLNPQPAQEDNDDIVNLWFSDRTQITSIVNQLQTLQAVPANRIQQIISDPAGFQAIGFGDPTKDDRCPDVTLKLTPFSLVGDPTNPKKRAEHGGFTDDDTHVAMILSGGISPAVKGTVRTEPVKTLQIAPTALEYLGLDPTLLTGAQAEGTKDLPGINDGPPYIVTAAFANPSTVAIAGTVSFSVTASSPQGLTLTYTWNFGDPNSPALATGPRVTHAYSASGFYTATVTVADGVNVPITSSVMVTVSPAATIPSTTPQLNNSVKNVIVIYQENWSFDGLYARFPGANGVAIGTNAGQIDVFNNNAPLASIPQPINNNVSPSVPDANFSGFPLTPVATFDLTKYIQPSTITGDIIHRFYTEQAQIDGGKNDKFVTLSDNPGLVLSQFDATNLPEGQLAQQFVMCDNFFHAAFGGSFLNHQWLISAQTPVFPNAPAGITQPVGTGTLNGNTGFDANGNPTPTKGSLGQSANVDNAVTPDGFAVNTLFTVNTPHPASLNGSPNLVPNQTNTNIGDLLNTAGVSWAWYSGGWDNALAGNPDPLFQFHHQAFAFYANYADGTALKKEHLRDETKFFSDLTNLTLPSVCFIKPLGQNNEHPGYAALTAGQQHVADIVTAVQNSAYWKNCVIIITYDEHGGRWDHVAPPSASNPIGPYDRWGPGVRVPTIIISPFAKRKFVDHTPYDTTSILKFIEQRWGLPNLSTRDAAVKSFDNALNFSQPPVIGTAASATPSTAFVGQSVSFNVGVSSPASLALTVTWDFGDKTPTATGATVTHAYAAAGTYNATVSISDAVNPAVTATVPVTVKAPAFGSGSSTDGSGLSDAIEKIIGTNFFGGAVPAPTTVSTVSKVGVKIADFTGSKDQFGFTGTLPLPAGTAVAGQKVFIDFGGEYRLITLDAKGHSTGNDSFSFIKGGAFKAMFKNANIKTSFGALGVTNASFAGKPLTFTINIFFNKAIYSHNVSATSKKLGKAGVQITAP